jgi:hypothetical protein
MKYLLFIFLLAPIISFSQTYCLNTTSYFLSSNDKVTPKNSPLSCCLDFKKSKFEICGNGIKNGRISFRISKPDTMTLEDGSKSYMVSNSYFQEWDNSIRHVVDVESRTYYIQMVISRDSLVSMVFGNSIKNVHFFINHKNVGDKKLPVVKIDTLSHFKMEDFPYVEKYTYQTSNSSQSNNNISKAGSCDSGKNWYNRGTGRGCYNGYSLITGPKGGIYYINDTGAKVYVTDEVNGW